MSYNIALFCSNPVNGGTAKVFYELVTSLRERYKDELTVRAAVNIDNPVEVYGNIENLDRLEVYSEEEVCAGLYGGNVLHRILKRMHRKIRYSSVKNKNISVLEKYLKDNDIRCVIIHNGGYVGDDLCNQMLEASYRCAGHTLCRMFVLHNDFKKNICAKIRFFPYDKKVSREATDIVTVSQFTRNRIRRSSFITKDISVIYNGLTECNTLTTKEKQKNINIDRNKKTILLLGNFLNNKGQLVFIDAARLICEKLSDCHITFIGNVYDEDYYKACMDKVKEYHIDSQVSIYHGINNASEYMDLFDVVAVPSMYDESFGLIAVEAMAKSTPVVVFACGGIPEVVTDGRDGYVVPVGDAEAMAERIMRILKDEDLAKQMGENGRCDYEKRFSIDTMCDKYYELMRSRMKCEEDEGRVI